MLIPIFASFQRLVFCSHASLDSFPGLFRWLAGDRVCVVQNAVDIDRVDRVIDSHARYFSKNGLVVASVGRLVEIKNHFSVLQAFSKSDDHVSGLMFIGEGHLHNQLLSESQALGLEERVNLTGLIPRREVYQNLTRADLFISASRGEGLPVAVLEAMACRCPVLLSDIAPHREIADGIDFIPLIDPDDVLGFACEIDRFRRMSSSQRAEVGEKCRKLVEDRFNLTNNHARYNEIYGQLLRREVGATQSSLVESDDGANSWRPGCG